MMKQLILGAALALALGACGQAKDEASVEASATEAATVAATGSASAPTPADPGAGAAPTREFMVGKWGEGDACDMPIDFRADGTMDGPVEKWELNGDMLTMVGIPSSIRLKVVDANTMESRADDGKADPRTLKRCK